MYFELLVLWLRLYFILNKLFLEVAEERNIYALEKKRLHLVDQRELLTLKVTLLEETIQLERVVGACPRYEDLSFLSDCQGVSVLTLYSLYSNWKIDFLRSI